MSSADIFRARILVVDDQEAERQTWRRTTTVRLFVISAQLDHTQCVLQAGV